MLKVIGLIVGGIVAVILLAVAWLYLRAVRGQLKAYGHLLERISPVTQALARGEAPAASLLEQYAANRETRKVLFNALDEAGKRDLFPKPYLAWELLAEADLVAWLCHPNELASPPSEIELAGRVPAPGQTSSDLAYFVFRYRMHEPHWAAKDGWLAGVAGPYETTGEPTASGRATFSRFEAFDSRTLEEHVAIVHTSILGGGKSAEAV